MGTKALKTFSLFEQWLTVKENKSDAKFIASALRSIERNFADVHWSSDEYSKDKFPRILRYAFEELSKSDGYTKAGKQVIGTKVKRILKDVYRIAITDSELFSPFDEINENTKKKYMTALRLYMKFLSEMFGVFSVSDLYTGEKAVIGASGKSRRLRKTQTAKSESHTPYITDDFKTGLVEVLMNRKVLFYKDGSIRIPLDELRKLYEDSVTLNGGTVGNVYSGISFITTVGSMPTLDWRQVFGNDMMLLINGEPLVLYQNSNIWFDQNTRELCINDHNLEKRYLLPLMSGRTKRSWELSCRMSYNKPIYEISRILQELRISVRGITKCLEEYNRAFKSIRAFSDQELDLEMKFRMMHEMIDSNELYKVSNYAFDILKIYAASCDVELVVE